MHLAICSSKESPERQEANIAVSTFEAPLPVLKPGTAAGAGERRPRVLVISEWSGNPKILVLFKTGSKLQRKSGSDYDETSVQAIVNVTFLLL